jgi:tetratricopeptide (TPR) repeat protein
MQRVFVLVVAAILIAPHAAAAQWLSLRSDHFRVVGNTNAAQLRAVALRLEQFREVVGQLNPALLREDSAPPVVVMVFRNEATHEPFMPVANGKIVRVGGLFVGAQDVNYITLNLEAGQQAYRAIFHEFSHLLTRGVFADAPLWFNEGLAEYYSTFEVVGGGRRANIGQPVANHVLLLRERTLPFAEFFSIDRNSPAYTTNTVDRRVLYAQAWAIVHHAFHGPSKRRDQLLTFVGKVANGTPTVDAFRETYGSELRDLEREVQDYVRNREYQFLSYDFPDGIVTRLQSKVEPISGAEADALLGDLLAHMGRSEDAAVHLQRALKADPDLEIAHAAMGTFYLRQGKTREGMTHLRRAVAEGTANEAVHFAFAFAVVSGSVQDQEALIQASRSLERAIELRPGYTEAKTLLAYTHLRTGRYAAARDLLTPIVRAEPTNHVAALNLAEALFQLDDFAGSRSVLGPVLARATSEEHRARARDLLGLSSKMEQRRNALAAARSPGSPPVASGNDSSALAGAAAGSPRSTPKFRQIGPGEERVYGVFEAVECGKDGVTFVIRTADAVRRARAARMSEVQFVSYRRLSSTTVNCGQQSPPVEVYLTWRVNGDAAAAERGTAVAIEFLPEGFVP